MSLQIRTISNQEISGYISHEAWEQSDLIPITPERARSQQHNPHSKPEDACLWVATTREGRVIGFAGSLPGYDIHNKERMGWNSCWWVDPERGKEAAMPLFFHFLKQWDQRVAFADMTPHTRAIIDQLDFCHTRSEVLVQSYIRLSTGKISSRLGIPGKILFPAILSAAFLVNAFQQRRLNRISRSPNRVESESRSQLDEELYSFIQLHQEKDFTRRSGEDFSWIEKHPWLVPGSPNNLKTGKKYPFSYVAYQYKLEWLVSRQGKTITSVMLISIRDGALKVLYYFGDQPKDALATVKGRVSADRSVATLIFAHPALVSQVQEIKHISLFNRFRSRLVGVSKKIMAEFPDDMVIQLGDGDSAFT